MTNGYFNILKYGDLLPLIFESLPLIIWIIYIYHVPLPWLRNTTNLGGTKYLIILSMLLPFSIVILNFYSSQINSDYDLSTAELMPGWRPCLSTKNITKENAKNGVVAHWDLKCGLQNLSVVNTMAGHLVDRFYYLSNAIFIFILVIYNSLSNNIFKIKHITYTLVFCLLLGIIGMLPAIYNTYYLKSLLFNRMIATFLTMDISAFFILILGILIQIRKK